MILGSQSRDILGSAEAEPAIAAAWRAEQQALADSEAMLRAALESTTDGVFLLSGDWRFTFHNRRAVAYLAPGRKLLGQVIWEAFPEAVNGPLWQSLQRCMAGRVPTEVEQHLFAPPGRTITARAFPAEGGGITVFLREVAEQRRPARTEVMLRALADASPSLLYVKGQDGRFLYANPAVLAVIGRTEADVLGRTEAEWHHDPAQAEAIIATDQRIKATGATVVVDEVFTDARCGEVRLFESTKTPLRDPGTGEVIGIVGISRDVTEAHHARAALTESEERFRALANAVPAMTWEADTSGAITWLSDAWARYCGRSTSDLLGHGWHRILDPEDEDENEALERWDEALRTGQGYSRRRRIRRASDGMLRWHLKQVEPVRDAAGTVTHWVGSVADVHDLVEAQTALREREEVLRLFVEWAPAAIAMFDTEMRYLAASRRFVTDYGLDVAGPDALIGRSHHELFSDVPAPWREVYRRVLAGETLSAKDDPFPRADGRTDRVRWEMAPWHQGDGSVGGVLLSSEVITARIEAERALAANEARFRAIAEAVPTILFETDADGQNLYVSPHFTEYSGLALTDLSGDGWLRVLHPDDRALAAEAWSTAVRTVGPYEIEYRFRRHDGVFRWFLGRGVPVRDAEGAIVRWIGAATDIDDQKQAEAAMRRSEARLAQAAKMEALGRLAGGIAHDFNNVLHVVQNGAEAAAKRLTTSPSEARRHLDLVCNVVDRGAAVTARLLAFARRGELKAEPIAPRPLLDALADLLRPTLGARIALSVVASPFLPALLADRSQLEAVLTNLANNARDAMPNGGPLVLAAEALSACAAAEVLSDLPACDYVRLAVIDEGTGMPPEVMARVTEPFFTTKPEGKGTGLGLAMARGFAEQSGGGLTIESVPGKGTAVMLWLPQVQPGAAPEGDAGPDAIQSGVHDGARTFLLVEDQREIRAIVAAELADGGHAVAEAEDAAAALALIDGGLRPDALITDLAMPGCMDGIDLVLTARARLPRLPALLVTGQVTDARPGKLAMATQGGPFAVVRKPASVASLVSRLQSLLHTSG